MGSGSCSEKRFGSENDTTVSTLRRPLAQLPCQAEARREPDKDTLIIINSCPKISVTLCELTSAPLGGPNSKAAWRVWKQLCPFEVSVREDRSCHHRSQSKSSRKRRDTGQLRTRKRCARVEGLFQHCPLASPAPKTAYHQHVRLSGQIPSTRDRDNTPHCPQPSSERTLRRGQAVFRRSQGIGLQVPTVELAILSSLSPTHVSWDQLLNKLWGLDCLFGGFVMGQPG